MEDNNIIGAFSEEQAAELSGVSANQLRRWNEMGFFRPAFGVRQKRVPYGRIYSFRDIVSLRVLYVLRNEERISLRHLKEVSEKLSHLGDARWTATTLFVFGKKVVVSDGPRRRREIVSGQHVLDIPLKIVIANTRKAVAEMNNRERKLGTISRARFIAQNEPVISGTRIPVSAIQDFASAGYSREEIMREYPDLRPADIDAALAYRLDTAA